MHSCGGEKGKPRYSYKQDKKKEKKWFRRTFCPPERTKKGKKMECEMTMEELIQFMNEQEGDFLITVNFPGEVTEDD